MLPAPARLRRREDFTAVVRRGRRAGRTALVVYRLAAEDGDTSPYRHESARVGFVVGRSVGNAVRRHEVTRRLRHLMWERLDVFDPGDRVVVRANPAASGRSSAELGTDLDRALTRLGLALTVSP
ncbi:MAG: ribonuclease P protein component [Geodermatophilaceae bacterium]